MPCEPQQGYRQDSCGTARVVEADPGAVPLLRIAVNPPLRCAIKDRCVQTNERPARREWPHEDAAFFAILFQANFYVLPEKA
jgi:hypothetical protein